MARLILSAHRDVTAWRATSGFAPLSDASALAQVYGKAEQRGGTGKTSNIAPSGTPAGPGHNGTTVCNGNWNQLGNPNSYVPSNAELSAFYGAQDNFGRTVAAHPYWPSVTGRPGATLTTDELIQWASHKWGIPTDWVRAEYVWESNWNQTCVSDNTAWKSVAGGPTQAFFYNNSPTFSQVASGTTNVMQSLGITQVRWQPWSASADAQWPGTEPLRWKSTAFNLDFQMATLRGFYDNPGSYISNHYVSAANGYVTGESSPPTTQWYAIGAWFSYFPYGAKGVSVTQYIPNVQNALAAKAWLGGGF